MEHVVLDFRVFDVGGPVREGVFYGADGVELGPAATERVGSPGGHVVFLLHGFNNSRQEGRRSLDGFAKLLGKARLHVDAIVRVLWPGDSPWGPLSYPDEERDADVTATKFASAIQDRMAGVARASFVAHSLGSRVTLRTVGLLAGSRVAVGQVVLMAAAVDRDALARPDRFRAAAETCDRVSNLSSTEDRVLKLAFPFGDGLAAVLFGGYTRGALGLKGPSPVRSHAVPTNVLGYPIAPERRVDHGDYLPSGSAAQFAADAIAGAGAPRYGEPSGSS